MVRLLRTCRGATTDQVLWRKHWTEGAITSQRAHVHERDPRDVPPQSGVPDDPEYRVGVARDLAHHVFKLIRKRQFALLRTDVRRFAAVHGGARTAGLIGQGMIETAKRAIAGSRS